MRFVFSEKVKEASLACAINEPMSGLYTRHYMNEVAPRFVAQHQRDENAGFAISLVEIDRGDFLKQKYGEDVYNKLFLAVATLVMENIRETDMAVHFADQQIAIFTSCEDAESAIKALERIHSRITEVEIPLDEGIVLTVDLQMAQAVHRQQETFTQLLARTEKLLLENCIPQVDAV